MGRATWLTPYNDLWRLVAFEPLQFGPAARAFGLVQKQVGKDVALQRWGRFLEVEPSKFLHPTSSLFHFVKHHAEYDPPEQLTLTWLPDATPGG